MRIPQHISWAIRLLSLLLCLQGLVSCSDAWQEENDVPQKASLFEWTRAADQSTRYAFLRNYGVGYSYNAVEGEYCNWNDIRCQIINRDVLERLEENMKLSLYGQIQYEAASQSSQYTYNQRDYVAGIHLNTKTAVDLGLYNKTKRQRQDVLEDGIQQSFYYSVERTITKGRQWLHDADILAYVGNGEYEYLFTESFRNAVKHMQQAIYEEQHDETYLTAMVDSFIQVYGTHVIVQATLGGKVRLDLKHTMWRYNDKVSEEQWSMEEILKAYSQRKENREDSIYQFIQNSSIYVTAYGGDQTYLKDFLGKTRYDGTREFSFAPLDNWQNSLRLDLNDEKNSNVELIDMDVRPIWDFIEVIDPDGEVADRVKAAITQNIGFQQGLLNTQYVFNTSFAVQYANPSVKIREQSGDYSIIRWNDVKTDGTLVGSSAHPCVHIVSGGQYVAIVCQEEIDGQLYTTVYPVYGGKANLLEGIAIKGQEAYALKWSYLQEKYVLTKMSRVPQTAIVYMNEGALSLTSQSELAYAESHPLLYLETTGGVQPDGTFKRGDVFVPTKKNREFVISTFPANKNPEQLIGWDWDAATQRAVRNSTYTYIYNPSEMDYVE